MSPLLDLTPRRLAPDDLELILDEARYQPHLNTSDVMQLFQHIAAIERENDALALRVATLSRFTLTP